MSAVIERGSMTHYIYAARPIAARCSAAATTVRFEDAAAAMIS